MIKNGKIVRINIDNYNKLKKVEKDTMDQKLNQVIDVVGEDMPVTNLGDKFKTIQIRSGTLDRLDTYRITLTEPRDCILARLMIAYEEKLNFGEDDSWAFFKITSRVNKKISLEGQVEYYSKDIIFNSDGDVYGYNLPDTYIVNGEDLTEEYNAFLRGLDIMDIMRKVLDHFGETTTLTYADYLLEIKS